MKLSRTGWLILGGGLFVILLGLMGMIYAGQAREQERLTEDLSQAEIILGKLVSSKEAGEQVKQEAESEVAQAELELEVAEGNLYNAEAELRAARVGFADSVQSIEVGEELLKIAEKYDLWVTGFGSQNSEEKDVEGVTYSVYPFTVEVEGELVAILGYVGAIAMGEGFTVAAIESVEIAIPERPEEVGEWADPATATINFVIYTYKGE
jgi:hypothetical protein